VAGTILSVSIASRSNQYHSKREKNACVLYWNNNNGLDNSTRTRKLKPVLRPAQHDAIHRVLKIGPLSVHSKKTQRKKKRNRVQKQGTGRDCRTTWSGRQKPLRSRVFKIREGYWDTTREIDEDEDLFCPLPRQLFFSYLFAPEQRHKGRVFRSRPRRRKKTKKKQGHGDASLSLLATPTEQKGAVCACLLLLHAWACT
jgi:hypothetical protein